MPVRRATIYKVSEWLLCFTNQTKLDTHIDNIRLTNGLESMEKGQIRSAECQNKVMVISWAIIKTTNSITSFSHSLQPNLLNAQCVMTYLCKLYQNILLYFFEITL